jgi:hypothetical protein
MQIAKKNVDKVYHWLRSPRKGQKYGNCNGFSPNKCRRVLSTKNLKYNCYCASESYFHRFINTCGNLFTCGK